MTETAVAIPAAPKPPLVTGASVSAIIPRNLDEVARVANAVLVAGLEPSSYRGRDDRETASRVIVGIMKGAEIGLPPMAALSTIAIINGRACLWGDGAMAVIQNTGNLEWIKESFEGEPMTDGWTAVCIIKRRGQSEPYERRFSWADATRAKLTSKGPWREYPQRMMRWRAASWAMRDSFADALMGLSIAEEAQDMPTPAVQIDSSSALADEVANDLPQIEHKPGLFVLRDAAGKERGAWDARAYVKALQADLAAATEADQRAIWFNNAETLQALPADFAKDRDALAALYQPEAKAAE